jgi:hypothetical protein
MHPGLLHTVRPTIFGKSRQCILLTNRKFKVSVEGELPSPRKIAAGVPQLSILAPVLYTLYINDSPATPKIHLSLVADDTCIYATEKHESRVLNNLKRGLTVVGS